MVDCSYGGELTVHHGPWEQSCERVEQLVGEESGVNVCLLADVLQMAELGPSEFRRNPENKPGPTDSTTRDLSRNRCISLTALLSTTTLVAQIKLFR